MVDYTWPALYWVVILSLRGRGQRQECGTLGQCIPWTGSWPSLPCAGRPVTLASAALTNYFRGQWGGCQKTPLEKHHKGLTENENILHWRHYKYLNQLFQKNQRYLKFSSVSIKVIVPNFSSEIYAIIKYIACKLNK